MEEDGGGGTPEKEDDDATFSRPFFGETFDSKTLAEQEEKKNLLSLSLFLLEEEM